MDDRAAAIADETFQPPAVLADVLVPVRTWTQLSGRSWRAHYGRAKRQRAVTAKCLDALVHWRQKAEIKRAGPLAIALTRIHPAGACAWQPADGDGVQKACKHVRDEVAAWLGVDDGDTAKVVWSYGQGEGAWGVRVRIFRRLP